MYRQWSGAPSLNRTWFWSRSCPCAAEHDRAVRWRTRLPVSAAGRASANQGTASVVGVHDPAAAPISFAEGDEERALVVPPGTYEGVCPWCQGLLAGRDAMCFNCEDNARALDGVVQPIVPISLYSKPSQLRDWLTFYKDDGDVMADPAAGRAIATILERFFSENQEWLTGLRASGAIVVPSTLRPPPHPLAVLLQQRGSLPFDVTYGLQRTAASLGHNQPNKDAFIATEGLRGRRILLLDDVYTSGARAQSAAYALRQVGAEVAALCVIGRRYNPGYSEESGRVFARQSAERFSWSVSARDPIRT